ncbi:ABC transporter family substrate-binding protein [Streptomyces sp. NPDC048172]|uniref:ABC transporter family substrate-binding protein n=1 Tax=Streptomyces sp. NPDC048172 TaxID=3365505 RepID=UPI0037241CDF
MRTVPERPAPDATGPFAGSAALRRRTVALLTAGVLLPLPLAGCSSAEGDTGGGGSGASGEAVRDVPSAARGEVASGGTLRWAVDKLPATLNAFQPDADEATDRVAGATLPALFSLDEKAKPEPNPDYLSEAEVTETEPRQTVVYKLNPKARWSDGRALGVADFKAQWRALRGKNSAYWTARNAGYDRIGKVTRGEGAHEVKVVFARPYADWKSLFTPLYPRDVMADPEKFNDGARTSLPASAGPFRPAKAGKGSRPAVLERNPRWWGERAKLSRIELKAVPRAKRGAALRAGDVDLADVDTKAARRVAEANKSDLGDHAGDTSGKGQEKGKGKGRARQQRTAAQQRDDRALRTYALRKALDPAYTQLSLNGANGPLADERVRRAVARALDRDELAKQALSGSGLPSDPLGSHLRMTSQDGYEDNSEAVGGRDLESAQSLLADAGWKGGGPLSRGGHDKPAAAGADKADERDGKQGEDKKGGKDGKDGEKPARMAPGGPAEPPAEAPAPDAAAPVPHRLEAEAATVPISAEVARQVTGRPLSLVPSTTAQRAAVLEQAARADMARARKADSRGGMRRARAALARAQAVGARAHELTMLSRGTATAVRTKDGKPLALRFVLPAGPGSEQIRATGERIADMLNGVGIRTQIKEVSDASYFKDHIAAGEYDLALYSWPATAYPATDARPIFAKPQPAADGSLLVEQNYSRVGTDQIDQLFEQAAGELDDGRRRDLMKKADARIWAAAGSLPLYQRPQLVAAKDRVVNAGAFGFQTPRYQDIGFRR